MYPIFFVRSYSGNLVVELVLYFINNVRGKTRLSLQYLNSTPYRKMHFQVSPRSVCLSFYLGSLFFPRILNCQKHSEDDRENSSLMRRQFVSS